jgi:hypothetical protein
MITRNGPPLQRRIPLARGVLSAAAVVLMTSAGCGGAQEPDPTWNPTVNPSSQEAWEDKPVDESGLLDILSVPDVDVEVDGKAVGKTPITAYKVKPGSHDITFLDDVTGNRTLTVIVQPGEAKTVKTDRPPRAVDDPK